MILRAPFSGSCWRFLRLISWGYNFTSRGDKTPIYPCVVRAWLEAGTVCLKRCFFSSSWSHVKNIAAHNFKQVAVRRIHKNEGSGVVASTPLKINIEHNHGGLEDHVPF